MRALGRWSPDSGPNHWVNKANTVSISPIEAPLPPIVSLPPSKSHAIRWLLLAAMSSGETRLEFGGDVGEDIWSMVRCIEQMGSSVQIQNGGCTIISDGLAPPVSVLHCGNSGTSLRLLAPVVASFGVPVMLDGDENLRRRDHSVLVEVLRNLGVEVSHGDGPEGLPLLIKGPIQAFSIEVDVSRSSQPYSGIMFSTATMDNEIQLSPTGDAVSRNHTDLTKAILTRCGMRLEDDVIRPWSVQAPDVVQIPPDASQIPYIRLLEMLHGCSIEIHDSPDEGGLDQMPELSGVVDLRDANDLIIPVAAMLCIGDGGEIKGAAHARHKESNRVEETVRMLSRFGLVCSPSEDGMIAEGGQTPSSPDGIVECLGDHRMFMTAAVLATKVGGELDSAGINRITWPGFEELITQPCRPK